MDRLDIRIVRELTQGSSFEPARPGLAASYRRIGRTLGVAPGTVRLRVQKMARTGFLAGRVAYVNPSALGLSATAYTIEVSPSLPKEAVLERIARVGGVIFFENFHGNLLGIGLLYEDEAGLKRALARIDRIARSTPVLLTRVPFPPSLGELSPAEWRTASRLMDGGPWSYAQLARDLGVSLRTVKRQLARLVELGVVFTFPRMDYRKILGGVTCELLVTFDGGAAKAEAERRILRRLEEWLTFAGVWETVDMFRLILPNVALLQELAKEVERVPGVRIARGEIVDAVLDRFGALQPYVARRLASPTAVARPGRARRSAEARAISRASPTRAPRP